MSVIPPNSELTKTSSGGYVLSYDPKVPVFTVPPPVEKRKHPNVRRPSAKRVGRASVVSKDAPSAKRVGRAGVVSEDAPSAKRVGRARAVSKDAPSRSLYLLRISSDDGPRSKSRQHLRRTIHKPKRRARSEESVKRSEIEVFPPMEDLPERALHRCYCGAPLKRFYFGPPGVSFDMRNPKDYCILCSLTKKSIDKCLQCM